MKKILVLLLLLCVIAAAFVIHGGVNSGDLPQSWRAIQDENTIYVGVFESDKSDNISGIYQEQLGYSFANSLSPTVKIGETEYTIELVSVDSSLESFDETAAAKSLIEDNKVSAVLASSDYAISEEVKEFFKSSGIPVIGAYSTKTGEDKKQDTFYGINSQSALQGGAVANYAYNKGYRHAAVVTKVGDTYSKSMGSYFSEEFIRLGGQITELHFNSALRNFVPLSDEIDDAKADMVFMPSSCDVAPFFISQSRQNGLDIPIFSGATWDSGKLPEEIGSYANDIFFASCFNQESSSDTTSAEFVQKFRNWLSSDEERAEKNGNPKYVSAYSALGYDAYMLLKDAIKTAQSFQPDKINTALKSMSYDGICGKVIYSENDEPLKRTIYLKSIDKYSRNINVIQESSSTK